jgi:hypothetical protein
LFPTRIGSHDQVQRTEEVRRIGFTSSYAILIPCNLLDGLCAPTLCVGNVRFKVQCGSSTQSLAAQLHGQDILTPINSCAASRSKWHIIVSRIKTWGPCKAYDCNFSDKVRVPRFQAFLLYIWKRNARPSGNCFPRMSETPGWRDPRLR